MWKIVCPETQAVKLVIGFFSSFRWVVFAKEKKKSLPYFKSLILIGRFSWGTKMFLYVESLKYCLLWSLRVCDHLVSAALEMHLSILISCTWHILKDSEPSSNFFACSSQMSWATSHLAPKLSLIVAERQKLVWYCWSESLLLLVNCRPCVHPRCYGITLHSLS